MEKTFITTNSKQTQKLGELLARELKGGEVICLDGELGAGKTTFTQGLLKGLKIKGPYTSPTFLIMKEYYQRKGSTFKIPKVEPLDIGKIYHFDAYRVEAQDILNLGFEEILSNKKNIIIIEWASRIEKIILKNSLQINFEWLDPPCVDERTSSQVEAGENKRKIIFKNK
ncbi:MAG: tRNA (adenosine(37)-N6)-threonylcarbamoyltransferase complex ATPase subunit type 1 TsaE [Parcubacteria group bacterium]|jgi:tRNA threonylcarbamoyladenosine biosynthesis protein TsaE